MLYSQKLQYLMGKHIVFKPGGGGYFHQNRTWMCLPDVENLTFSIPTFCLIPHPSVYHFSQEKHPILTKLGAFYNDLAKIHPIYVIWAPSSLMKPPIAIPNFAKNHLKRHTMSMSDPPSSSLPPSCSEINSRNRHLVPINLY